nr:immunoglobulin heavy chain junction region [Mus musculus]
CASSLYYAMDYW